MFPYFLKGVKPVELKSDMKSGQKKHFLTSLNQNNQEIISLSQQPHAN